MTEKEQRAETIKEALTFIGTPFRFSGTLKGIGIACGPFICQVYQPYARDAGRTMPIPPIFARDWHCHRKTEDFRDFVLKFCAEVETPQPGDVALFRLGASTRPFSHGALVIEWPERIIHSFYKSGVEISSAYQLPLRPELAKFFSPWAWRP